METLRRFALPLVFWPLLVGLWALLVVPRSLAEMLAGTGFAAITVIAFEAVRREGRLRFRPRRRWLGLLLRLPLRVLGDTVIAFRVLGRLVRGEDVRGDVSTLPFEAAGGSDARSVARRAAAVWLISAAPNTIAVEIDPERAILLVHRLEPGHGPPLGAEIGERGR